MPALDAGLVAAIRAGTVARHVFIELDHSQGVVRAWDGVGEYVLDGATYFGVAGLASVSGVSASADVQNHEVELELNGVPLEALRETDPDIRGRVCTVRLVWVDRSGVVVGSRIVFRGHGSNLKSRIETDSLSLTARIRGAMADWSTIPRAYYTDAEQQRRYPGDTGFSEIRRLENAVVTGWGQFPESSGENVVRGPGISGRSSIDFRTVGAEAHGNASISTFNSGLNLGMYSRSTGASTGQVYALTEETTGASISVATSGAGEQWRTTSGACYVDVDGYVRTPGGKAVLASGQRVRRALNIASNGAQTANAVRSASMSTSNGTTGFTTVSVLVPSDRFASLPSAAAPGQTFAMLFSETGTAYAPTLGALTEVGTGNACSFIGSTLVCNGADVNVSTTGVALTNTGRRVKQGANDSNFLRVWS